MSTGVTWQIESTSLNDTLAIAGSIGQRLHGGEVIELLGDLGSGKTAFVRGLAAGAGSEDAVRSPSFTINNQYQAGQITIYHFDFYRLNDPGVVQTELAEILQDQQAVVVIEWAEVVVKVLPAERIAVRITPTGDETRRLEFQAPPQFSYLFPTNT